MNTRTFFLGAVCLACAIQAGAQTFVTFNVPTAGKTAGLGTQGLAINDVQTIAGSFYVQIPEDGGYTIEPRGFVRTSDGTITHFNNPGTDAYTSALCINASGTIGGTHVDSKGPYGYLRSSSGTMTDFTVMGNGATVTGINSAGTATGYFDGGGFVRTSAGKFKTFQVNGVYVVQPSAINAKGAVTGTAFIIPTYPTATQAFVREPNGDLTSFSTSNYDNTYATAINEGGTVVGYTYNLNGTQTGTYGFARAANGAINLVEISGAGTFVGEGTYLTGINKAGTIVGYYIDSNLYATAFTIATDGTVTTYEAPGAGTVGDSGTFPMSINTAGDVAGYYIDSQGVYHGFLMTP
ncbi:MAG: hypothetical protein ACLP59_18990 [Bryobacteraceae bacterium]